MIIGIFFYKLAITRSFFIYFRSLQTAKGTNLWPIHVKNDPSRWHTISGLELTTNWLSLFSLPPIGSCFALSATFSSFLSLSKWSGIRLWTLSTPVWAPSRFRSLNWTGEGESAARGNGSWRKTGDFNDAKWSKHWSKSHRKWRYPDRKWRRSSR